MNKQSGFSLVELMVVVAIIGVLSSIAVPNYHKMSAKARQSEAKAALSAIYAAEQSFFAMENSYTYCLYQAGYVPEGATRFYLTGFLNGIDGGCGGTCWRSDFANNIACSGVGVPWGGGSRNDATFSQNRWTNPALTGAGLSANYMVTRTQFNAVAFGSISAAPILDVWSVNQDKRFVNEQPGH